MNTTHVNNETKKCVLIIPYFGKLPPYFNIWLKSAEANPEFTFLFYTDADIDVSKNSNVIVKKVSFSWLQNLIRDKLGGHCVIDRPYKVCDYKTSYGYIFSEDIAEYDFWGFCDPDIVFGNLKNFVTQEILSEYDVFLSHGSFMLLRNNEFINTLFFKKYNHVLDFDYACRTKYVTHFDENACVVFSPIYDSVKMYTPYIYCETDWTRYRMDYENSEMCAVWDKGTLYQYWNSGAESKELMYIHLQKRRMKGIPQKIDDSFGIIRNFFVTENTDPQKILALPVDEKEEKLFYQTRKKDRAREIFNNIKQGALKFRFYRFIKKWNSR